MRSSIQSAILSITLATLCLPLAAQTSSTTSTPQAYPYTFSNFIWWSDSDLRAALKRKLPSLGEELVPYSALDEKVRLALTDLLKTKGIHAEVQTVEVGRQQHPPAPVDNIVIGIRASRMTQPNTYKPAIVYGVLAPPVIKVGEVTVEGAPSEIESAVRQLTHYLPGQTYNSAIGSTNLRIAYVFQNTAYLSGTGEVVPGAYERKEDDLYVVPLTIKIHPGPQYHIATIKADGGPLFKGVDLSRYIPAHPGDVAVPGMCSRLVYALRDSYRQAGYAYADVQADPILDKDHALASYNITVDPGPLYHFRNLAILHLDAAKQQAVRTLLGMKSGDVYNPTRTMSLQTKLQADPAFTGMRFTFGAVADEAEHLVDVTLDFFKQ